MQDLFTYAVSNINGHAPTLGSGTWTTFNLGTGSAVASTGSQANLICSGTAGGGGQAIASYPFVPSANTVYTLSITYNFNGPVGASAPWNWVGCGFSSTNSGVSWPSNHAPWILIQTQSTGSSTPLETNYCGGSSVASTYLPAADYTAPSGITATVTWNTCTGEANYYINGVYQCTGTTAAPSGQVYAVMQAYATASDVSVKNITLSAQTLQSATMLDHFDYIASNIAGHAPTMSVGGWGKWTTNNFNSSCSVASTGTQANLICQSGTMGMGQAIANYVFLTSTSTFYSLRITYQFNGPVGNGAPWNWVGFGFSSGTTGMAVSNNAPWMQIPPQATGTSTSLVRNYINGSVITGSTIPASAFNAPITAAITWNTITGEAKYYINGLYQCTGTSTVPGGQLYAVMQAYQSGTAVSVLDVAMSSQPLPLPLACICPANCWDYKNYPYHEFPTMFDSGTGSAAWASARSHLNMVMVPAQYFVNHNNDNNYPTDAETSTFLNYTKNNNLQVMLQYGPLTGNTNNACQNGEGYLGWQYAQNYCVPRIYQLSGSNSNAIACMQFDEPLNFGYEKPCLGMQECANETNQTVQAFRYRFPGMAIRDVESLEPLADVQSWITAIKNTVGSPGELSYSDDHDWSTMSFSTTVSLANAIIGAGSSYGVIFNQEGGCVNGTTALTPAQWIRVCMQNVQSWNASILPSKANHISFESWSDPAQLTSLPETSPCALTYMVNYFFATPQALEPPPVPLFQVKKSGINVYTADPVELSSLLATGGSNQYILGNVYTAPAGAIGLVPLSRYNNSSTGQYAMACTSAEANAITANGFHFEKVLGYVYPASDNGASGGQTLYECYYGNLFINYDYNYGSYYTWTHTNMTPGGWGGTNGNGIECYVMPYYFNK